MNRRYLFGLLLLVLFAAVLVLTQRDAPRATAAPDSPAGFASPINGGCYIAAPDVCKIHIDPFVININDAGGAHLLLFELYANGNLIYGFSTDVSNPPRIDYAPSLVTEDFAATCGETYVVNMLAQDSTDGNRLNYGQTKPFTCPSAVP